MEKKHAFLSLGAWPHSPPHHSTQEISPISRRILNQVHLTVGDILPLTFADFCKTRKDAQNSRENYEFENARRVRQVSILADIRNKYILGEVYNTPTKRPNSKSKSSIKSRELSKNSCTSSRVNQFSNQKVIQALSRIKSQRKGMASKFKSPVSRRKHKDEESDYFIHFNPHTKKTQKTQKTQRTFRVEKQVQQQSTKGNEQKKSLIIQQRHSEYGNFIFSKNRNLRNNKKSHESSSKSKIQQSKQLCHELITTMERWQQLDRQHLSQMTKMKDLSHREKERLSKMQQIQKNEMRTRIKRIKSRLSSQSQRL